MGTTQKSAHKNTDYLGYIKNIYNELINSNKSKVSDGENKPTRFTFSKPAKFAQNRRKELKLAAKRRMKKYLK